jgi:hypothetical protein
MYFQCIRFVETISIEHKISAGVYHTLTSSQNLASVKICLLFAANAFSSSLFLSSITNTNNTLPQFFRWVYQSQK